MQKPLPLLKEVDDLFAGIFGVIDGDFAGFVGSFANVLGGDDGIVSGDIEDMFGAIGGFNHNGLPAFANLCDYAVDRLDTILADVIDFNRTLLRALNRIVDNNFRAFFEAVKGVLCARGGLIATFDNGAAHEMNGMFCAVFRFNDNGLCGRVCFGDDAVDSRDNVIGSAQGNDEKGCERQETQKILHETKPSRGF
jgi:hypothetical protein